MKELLSYNSKHDFIWLEFFLFFSDLISYKLTWKMNLKQLFSSLTGKMFQAPDLNLIVEFIFMFYKEKPIDWLLDHILWVKVCNPEKDAVRTDITEQVTLTFLGYKSYWFLLFAFFPPQKHCERQKSSLRVRFRPSLFQHVGLHSSLAGKIQKLTVRPTFWPLFMFRVSWSSFLYRNPRFPLFVLL